ncbi:unnamed protein product [Oppiella nova]|uniref:Protein kinase domain-containing protein n=1 Tax=Oppiella nova TaxID=334625 RepID=A0A7R9QN08_9ACAR|nr:unnamed protein product [Oppiella nova]CAG2168829.1 unnamed protein product [Oppiella nova]
MDTRDDRNLVLSGQLFQHLYYLSIEMIGYSVSYLLLTISAALLSRPLVGSSIHMRLGFLRAMSSWAMASRFCSPPEQFSTFVPSVSPIERSDNSFLAYLLWFTSWCSPAFFSFEAYMRDWRPVKPTTRCSFMFCTIKQERIFFAELRVDFPHPEGPISAVRLPKSTDPLIPLSMAFGGFQGRTDCPLNFRSIQAMASAPDRKTVRNGRYLQVADFGLATVHQHSSDKGDLRYQAPEVGQGVVYNHKIDIYSLAKIADNIFGLNLEDKRL